MEAVVDCLVTRIRSLILNHLLGVTVDLRDSLHVRVLLVELDRALIGSEWGKILMGLGWLLLGSLIGKSLFVVSFRVFVDLCSGI